MVVNPFILLFIIYFSSNTFAFVLLLINGGFNVFGSFHAVDPITSIFSYSLQVLILFFLAIFIKRFFSGYSRHWFLSNFWGFFLIFISLAFFAFNQVTGAGKAGDDFSFNGGSYLNIMFVLVQPDLWFLLIAPFLISSRLFWVSLIIYFVSLLSRGWMGSVLLVFIAFLIRYYPVRIKLKNSLAFFVFSALIFFLLPLLDAMKWGMRTGSSVHQVLLNLLEADYWSLLYVVLESVILRFQNLNYVAYTFQNRDFFIDKLFQGEFSWFFQNGIFNSIYCKLATCSTDINIFVAETIYGESGLSWNVDPGVSGWFFILGFYSVLFFLFSIFLIVFSSFVYKKIYGRAGSLLLGVFLLLYYFHGWFNAFFNCLVYACIFYIFLRLSLGSRRNVYLERQSGAFDNRI